ncbi:Daunorubicin/doxorubicin resistance ATP-binding protein DrrA [Actinomyces viscosus]|uniref:Daunorubicin/doxorubicin resistance ATP-binding protein DrrA n=2 Tax=Actinomyces viscosus TaxID=1656 RepID=A0A3S4V1P4_ACTVI|nr:Daunorubicin/doxorubicin resistance ATP-binding protein DrrA [Actinomyces viscosus]
MTPQATTKTTTAKPPAAASGTTAAQPFTGDMAQPPVRVQGLVKRFGRFRALDHLDLEVEAGSVHGFLGPNGAGKSTTIRTLLGLYRPDGGSVSVLGRDPWREASAVNRQVSYVPGDVALWPGLTGGQVLDALAGLRGSRDTEREAELIERFDLDPSKRVRTYSKGNRQKVALVAALAAPTSLLVLDEPTSSLDPLMERVFTEEITRAAAQGRTVLLSSHILAEVQRLCSAVTIIKDGRVVEHGDLGTLRRLSRTRIELGAPADVLGAISRALRPMDLDAVEDNGRLSLEVAAEQVPTVMGLAGEHRVQDVTCEPASLEDLFLRHYEEAR